MVRLSALRTGLLYPRKCPWYSFLLEAESTPGSECDRKDFISMKNSNDTIWNRTSDLPICSTAPYLLCYRGPFVYVIALKFFRSAVLWFTGMYNDILRRLSGAVRRKRPLKWRTNRFLLHDNAPAHRSVLVKDFLAKRNVTTQELLSTSPLERNEHWRDGAFVIIKNAKV